MYVNRVVCENNIFLVKQFVGYIFKQACCYVFGLDKSYRSEM